MSTWSSWTKFEDETPPQDESPVTVRLTNLMPRGGKTIAALVDTGAEGNLIRENLIPRKAIKPFRVRFNVYHGESQIVLNEDESVRVLVAGRRNPENFLAFSNM